ncbi:hypothetical protein K523DRAFT_358029 [Schizophyllum commune Tattone D]|nr:hypothetical protein K523DRAFT_358029 [Schizophyllum commune Tattone D]
MDVPEMRQAFEAADIAFLASGCSTMPGQVRDPVEAHPFAVRFYSQYAWRDRRSHFISKLRMVVKDTIALLDLVTVSSSFFATTSPLNSPYTHPTVEGTHASYYVTAQTANALSPSSRARFLNMLQMYAETVGICAPTYFNSIKTEAFSWHDRAERHNSYADPAYLSAHATQTFSYSPDSPSNVYDPHPFGYFHTIQGEGTDNIGPLDALQAHDLYRRVQEAENAAHEANLRAEEAIEAKHAATVQADGAWQRVRELEAKVRSLKMTCEEKDLVISLWETDYKVLQEKEKEVASSSPHHPSSSPSPSLHTPPPPSPPSTPPPTLSPRPPSPTPSDVSANSRRSPTTYPAGILRRTPSPGPYHVPRPPTPARRVAFIDDVSASASPSTSTARGRDVLVPGPATLGFLYQRNLTVFVSYVVRMYETFPVLQWTTVINGWGIPGECLDEFLQLVEQDAQHHGLSIWS